MRPTDGLETIIADDSPGEFFLSRTRFYGGKLQPSAVRLGNARHSQVDTWAVGPRVAGIA